MSLGTIVTEAMRLYRQMKAGGMSQDEALCGLERTLRDVWPKPLDGRTEPWHYVCELCGDTGLRIFTCRRGRRCNGISTRQDGPFEKAGKYRRLCALHPESDYEHEYGEPCYCDRGARFKDAPKSSSDFTEAGKTPKAKPRGFTRFGQ